MTVSSNQSLQQQLLMLHPSVTSTLDSLVDRLNEASASNKDVFAVLLGTSDGISLAHSFGTDLESGPQLRSGLSEEMLSKIERTWATLPSDSLQGAGHYLRPLSLGGIITATVFFDNVVLTHVHFSPLVVTFICHPSSNLGAVRAVFPRLLSALEPLRSALEKSSQQKVSSTN